MEGGGKKKTSVVAAIIGYLAAGGAIMILIGIGGFWTYRIWRRKTRDENNEVSPGPYKNLGSESSQVYGGRNDDDIRDDFFGFGGLTDSDAYH